MASTDFSIEGMTCTACSTRIEKVLNKKGVNAKVNLATEKAHVEFADDSLLKTNDDIIEAIQKLGYQASVDVPGEESKKQSYPWILWMSLILTSPFLIQMAGMLIPGSGIHLPGWLQIALATPVQLIAGFRFYKGAFHSILSGVMGMDVLVSLGTTVAYLYSLYLFATGSSGHALYFEASTMVLTLVLLGKVMESRAKSRTVDAIRKLMDLAPPSAILLTESEDGKVKQQEVPAEDLVKGNLILVKPGSRIPVDGIITDGTTAIDESMLTGESNPVEKKENDRVMAGTLNTTHAIHIRATGTGENTTLANIIKMVEEAQGSRAPIQDLADKVSSVFVPAVLAVSLLTFIGWLITGAPLEEAIIHAVAVLVISCPCALGLATPTALMVGTGLAAKHGILIRNAEAIERAGKAKFFVFDKTGTITQGMPQITDIVTYGKESAGMALQIAASLESRSEHPIAKAFIRKAADENIDYEMAKDAEALSGSGVKGTLEGKEYTVCSPEYITENYASLNSEVTAKLTEIRQSGKTASVLWNMSEQTIIALFGIADLIKEEAARAVQILHKENAKTALLTGDHEDVAAEIARQAGIDTIKAGVKPGEKRAAIQEWKKDYFVAMVGDGINDAPALAEADISFAMGSGADAALEAADITLMRKNVVSVTEAVDLSKATIRKIKQNLFFAFVYNTLGIPLAAAGFLSPVVAGAAMALSSVSVVTSSLLLKNWRPKI